MASYIGDHHRCLIALVDFASFAFGALGDGGISPAAVQAWPDDAYLSQMMRCTFSCCSTVSARKTKRGASLAIGRPLRYAAASRRWVRTSAGCARAWISQRR